MLEMIRNLFRKSIQEPIRPVVEIPEHIEKQRGQGPPFYCGTAFCGHARIEAAAECWRSKCEGLRRAQPQIEELRKQGKWEEANALLALYYPEMTSDNWPINRSSSDLRNEYIERAKREAKVYDWKSV